MSFVVMCCGVFCLCCCMRCIFVGGLDEASVWLQLVCWVIGLMGCNLFGGGFCWELDFCLFVC